MKKTLFWLAAALFVTAISVPTPLMADGNPYPWGQPNGPKVIASK